MKTLDIDLVVMGQNYSTSLGLIQAAGEAGFRCGVVRSVVNPTSKLTPELKSKYVKKFLIVDRRNEKEVLSILVNTFSNKDSKTVLCPADDYCVSFIDRNLAVLEEYFFVPNIHHSEGEMIRNMDKQLQSELALSSGLLSAQNWSVDLNSSKKIIIPEEIVFPCITKPQISIGSPKTFIRRCDTYDDLIVVLQEINKTKPCSVLVEEYINIDNEFTVPGVVIDDNIVIPALIKKTLVGSGAHRGVTISGVVLDASRFSSVVNAMKRLVKSIGLEGIFDIELFESRGMFYFNEMNLRYGAAGYAVTRAGVNLPAMWINHCLGRDVQLGNFKLQDGLTFVSDKAVLDYYSAGYMGWKEYKKLVSSVDFRFLVDNVDTKVKRAFKITEQKNRISTTIQKFKL